MNDRGEDLINGLSVHSSLLDGVMKLGATDLVFMIALVLLGLWFWPAAAPVRALHQRLVVAAAAAAVAALTVGALIGTLHAEARPFVTDASTRLLIRHAADNSLPSDHALVSFGVAGTLLWWRRRLGIVLAVVGLLIGIARVYVGVHWPGDIVAGAVVGLLIGSIAAATVPWWSGPQRLGARFLSPRLLAPP